MESAPSCGESIAGSRNSHAQQARDVPERSDRALALAPNFPE